MTEKDFPHKLTLYKDGQAYVSMILGDGFHFHFLFIGKDGTLSAIDWVPSSWEVQQLDVVKKPEYTEEQHKTMIGFWRYFNN